MSFEYIKPTELLTTFNDAKKFMTPLFEPFEEFERIARNRPHGGIDKRLPKVTDGTLASLIKEDPKRVFQQIPTSKVLSEDKWLELIAGYILKEEIIPNSDEDARYIQKIWTAISKSKTYGSQPALVKFLNRGDYFGTDFVLPYIKDVYLEPGKISDRASNVIQLSTWWSKNMIEALIAKEKKLSASAKDREEEYEGGWDLGVLADLITEKPGQKDVSNQSPSEKQKQLNNGFYQLVHVFQRGIDANFYTFAPRLGDDVNNLARTKKNPDPRGVIPIHYLYADQDLSNPLGVGAVEMSGGLQNLLDSEVQLYQYNRALMLNPPLKKWGKTPKSAVKFIPNHIMEMNGTKATDDVEAFVIDSSALQSFPSNFGLIKSEILNLNSGGGDTSVSSDVGNPGFSKTDAGVKQLQSKLSIGDNYTRKQAEAWLQDIQETQLNLYFAERHGVQELTLDEETAFKLNQLKEGAVDEDNKIRIDYDEATPVLKLRVDPASSEMEDNATQVEANTKLLEIYSNSEILQQQIPPEKVDAMWNAIVGASGVQDPEKLSIEVGPDGKRKQEEEAEQTPEMTPEAVMEIVQQALQEDKANDPAEHPMIKLMSSLNIKFTDLDPDTQRKMIFEIFGIESTGTLPSEVDQAGKAAELHLKADAQAHSQSVDTAKLVDEDDNRQHDQAVKLMEMAHSHEKEERDEEMNTAQFAHTVNEADRSHEITKASVESKKEGAQNESD